MFDDYVNIVKNKSLAFDAAATSEVRQAVVSGNAGPLKRPISMLSFAMNRALTGLDPFYFKLTNLIIHLANGMLVFVLVRQLLNLRAALSGDVLCRSEGVALAATGIWLIHPAQLTSVLYVVQRMTSLSATFVFLALIVYIKARAGMVASRAWRTRLWIGVPFLTGLACLAKENGALVFMLALSMELAVFNFGGAFTKGSGGLRNFFLFFVAIPALAVVVFLALNPGWVTDPHMSRPFSVVERLLTEARVLFLYLYILCIPAIDNLSLYYDDFPISRGLADPWTTGLAVVTWICLVVTAIVVRKRRGWFSFAVLWFLTAHLIESTIVMLELVHVHRNYVAYLGPILAGCVGANQLLSKYGSWVRPGATIFVLATLMVITTQRAQQWGHPFELVAYEVNHRPASSRANYELGRLYYMLAVNTKEQHYRDQAERYFERATAVDPRALNAPVALMIMNAGQSSEADATYKDVLVDRLSARPVTAAEVHFLRSLVECPTPECRQMPNDIIDVFGAALAHPLLRRDVKANLLAILGMYYANNLNDVKACIRLMKEAVAIVPNDPNHRLNLVHAYIAAKDLRAAKQELQAAIRRDKLRVYGDRIDVLEKDIAQLEDVVGGA